MLPVIKQGWRFPRLADDFFGRDWLSSFLEDEVGMTTPAVNINEGKDHFRIELAAPGLDKEDFRISLDHNVLTISSEKKEEKTQDDDQITRREFSYSSFSRSFTLPEAVNPEKIKAEHKNGILSIVLPKKDEAKVKPARQIKIS
ncbi:MAG: Hsp20/alpha crystallin family protein [Bacteroidales bacterium]|nr:Hsp20/alpha crystallin family protein [Bacteroidales bacterium]